MRNFLTVLAISIVAIGCNRGDAEYDWQMDDRAVRVVCNFEGKEWNALVDNPQNGGPLLYSGNGYSWHDTASDLASELPDPLGDKKFWGGGVALSSYFTTDYTTACTPDEQLTVLTETARSGKNCVVCYNGFGDTRSYIYFKDEPRYIESAWVAHTSYSYAMAKDGLLGTFPVPALTNESIWIVATGYTLDEQGNEIEGESVKFYLYKDGKRAFENWREWDLAPLGKIKCLKFDMRWNGVGEFSHPAYFALDDITVVYIK